MRCFVLFCFFFAALPVASAQESSRIDLYRLTLYYQEYIREGQRPRTDPTVLERLSDRITNERLAIRSLIEKDFLSLIEAQESEDPLSPRKALDRERIALALLQDRLKERQVDLSLLEEEEELYEKKIHTATGAQAAGIVLRTKTHAELLANKALLEEQVDVLARLIQTQEERVKQLKAAERNREIDIALSFLFYLGIILAVTWAERLIRRLVLMHIPHRTLRYAVTKIFMTAVYGGLIFWLVQDILSDYPTILTAVAFVSAAAIVTLQDVIKGFVGWLMQSQSLALGNRVTLGTPAGQITGDVVDVGILYTSLLIVRTPDLKNVAQVGKIVRVPNSHLLTSPLVNYNSTSDFIRVELPLMLKDPSLGSKAKQIFETILREETDKFFESAHRQIERRTRRFFFPPEFHLSTVFMELAKDGVSFILCFMVPMRKRRLVVTQVTEAVLRKCKEEGIEIVFSKKKEE